MLDDDHETRLLDVGDRVIKQKVAKGYSSLSPRARLICCLWAADYGLRNAGDLTTAADLHPAFLNDGPSAVKELGLPHAAAAFSLTSEELERQYLDLFNDIVAEIRIA